MRTKRSLPGNYVVPLFMLSLLCTSEAGAQYNERPDLASSDSAAVDVSGRSIKNQRVRAIHTEDPDLLGGTAYFILRDPFLAYQLGRNLNFREFRLRDGVLDPSTGGLGGPMPDGSTAKITVSNHLSCSGCHNLPQGNPGGGVTFHKDSGFGRNSPHYYGSGIMEMLALQVRAEILSQLDTNGDGWVSVVESAEGPGDVRVEADFNSDLSFGSPRLSNGSTGTPAFNNIIRVWYVDGDGRPVPGASSVDGVSTFGYGFEVVIWGWGQGPGRSALNPTTRAFFWDPAKAHSGLESCDPSSTNDPDGDGVSEPTLAGAIQFPVTHKPNDTGIALDDLGFSRDDPDGDGVLNEISEGDLDLAEWYMLHSPRPAFAGTTEAYEQGVHSMKKIGCLGCHTQTWKIRPADEIYDGDRRLWDFDVRWNSRTQRLEGELVDLSTVDGENTVPRRRGFSVDGIFSDLRHHDMGPRLAETDFGGTVNTVWRTPPLWGVGSGFPWGHDGRSLTLEDIILRHGGEAQESRDKWIAVGPRHRDRVLRFLSGLQLYDIESLPADIDGDGVISSSFEVSGRYTGIERFNAEWLFNTPLTIEGIMYNTDGKKFRSYAGVNVDEAYGQDLPLRRDSDADGWPDVWDAAPLVTGYKNGVD